MLVIMKKAFLIIILLITFNFSFSQWTVNTVPDPKTTGTGFVSNPDKILRNDEVSYLDSVLTILKDSTTSEVAVVMLQSIGDAVPKTFATKLFNHWHIGNAETDNGLLILFVMDQHRIEFETGYGIEQTLTDAKCYSIQQKEMVPRFKQGLYGQGIVDGVNETIRVLLKKPAQDETTYEPARIKDPIDTEETNSYDYYKPKWYSPFLEIYSEFASFFNFYFSFLAFAFGLFFLLFIISISNKDYFARYQTMRIFRLYFWFILFPIPFIAIYYFVKKLTEKWRNTPRVSAKTGLTMHKLSEEEDNQYLEKGQIAEEKVKSVDYDVWISGEEGDVLIQSYKRWFSKYNACPKCKYKTYYKVYDRVITAATYSSSGSGEKKHSCTNCGHSKVSRYTIPQKTRSSSSSSSSSSYSGGSSSWGGSSSSSWGGGSSGGGGAGSSW